MCGRVADLPSASVAELNDQAGWLQARWWSECRRVQQWVRFLRFRLRRSLILKSSITVCALGRHPAAVLLWTATDEQASS